MKKETQISNIFQIFSRLLGLFLCGLFLMMAAPVQAQPLATPALSGDVDLILPPALASQDAPFYRGASVKVGETLLPVREEVTTNGKLAEYQPENNRIVVSNDAHISEDDKAQALLNVVTAMQANAIVTAAGE